MIENRYLESSAIEVRKIIPSSVKRNGKPVRAQIIFFLEEQIGSGKNKVIVRHSQTIHVRLEDDGKYHYRNTKIVMAENKHGQLEAKSVPVHFEFTAASVDGLADTPPIAVAA